MANRPSILKAVLVATLMGFFLQLAGFVMPWWFVIGDSIYISMWYFLHCEDGIRATSNCTTYVYNVADTLSETDTDDIVGLWMYTAVQILVTVALGLVFISSIVLIISVCAKSKQLGIYGLTCFMLFLSALLLLPVIGFFAWIHAVALSALTGYKFEARSFPWSVLASGVGLLCTFIGFVTLAVALCRWRSLFDDDDDYYQGYGGDPGYVHMANMDNTGYDNTKYAPERNSYGHDKGYPQKPYPVDRQYPSQPQYGNSQKYGQAGSNNYGYSSDNLYRGYKKY